ncbi:MULTISPECIES: hypothetical protein [Pseudomonas]|uniref:Uncharacterized protein n=1 Tax=Pseudomonas quercus TaxID=2722792 RepID=A0ABX0YJV2_9PSED|nr:MULTISPECIES: hypothetical protein [Pseudomonas]MBF7144659.1 hypothetical protein [Pseudomonas sp. LY10J]NJP03197.1 hypothetical protein [Pseudomonas quercus]
MPTQDKLALYRTGAQINNMLHRDLNKVPEDIRKAWTAFSKGTNNTQDLEILLDHLFGPSASEPNKPTPTALDKQAILAQFNTHMDALKKPGSPNIKPLQKLYDSLENPSTHDAQTTLDLIDCLFKYGFGKLPKTDHLPEISNIINALLKVAEENSTPQALKHPDHQQARQATIYKLQAEAAESLEQVKHQSELTVRDVLPLLLALKKIEKISASAL